MSTRLWLIGVRVAGLNRCGRARIDCRWYGAACTRQGVAADGISNDRIAPDGRPPDGLGADSFADGVPACGIAPHGIAIRRRPTSGPCVPREGVQRCGVAWHRDGVPQLKLD